MENVKLILIVASLVCLSLLAGCVPDGASAQPPAAETNEDSSGCGIYNALSRIGDDDNPENE